MPRAKKTTRPPVGYEPHPEQAKFQMAALVFNLNALAIQFSIWTDPADPQSQVPRILDFRETKKELTRLVEAWKSSGPNLLVFFAKHPELKSRLFTQRMHLVPTNIGQGHLVCDHVPLEFDPRARKDLALMQFAPLITNPLCELLGGPCARCRKYYLKNTRRQKVYCSRDCATGATSVKSVRKTRVLTHAADLKKAQGKVDEWLERPREGNWKEWVSSELQLSLHWITRALNKGELKAPTTFAQQAI